MYRVLIVEDEELIRKGLTFTFDWLKHDCVVIDDASNGKEGLEIIKKSDPDIVITDIKMPLMNGLEMIENCSNKSFETIIISGFADFEYAKKAIHFGVNEFILKPIDHLILEETLVKLIKKIKKKKMIEKIENEVKNINEFNLIDFDIYFQQSNYDTWFIPEVLEIIEKKYSKRIGVKEIAHSLEISTAYLSRKFKAETNHTLSDFLNRYRIQKSLDYFQEDIKIYEISRKVGFGEYKYFSRVFKKYLKCSPTDFMNSKVYIKNNK